MTLTEFLLARIAEDEEVARSASPAPWSYGDVDSVAGGMLYDETRTIAGVYYEQPEDHDGSTVRHLLVPEADANGAHIARHNPARVLAECEAKRRIVEDYAHLSNAEAGPLSKGPLCAHAEYVVRMLAAVYADLPDYDEELKP